MATDYAGKIEKALALANDPATPQETREQYMAQVERLMLQWGVNDAELNERRKAQKKSGEKIIETKIRLTGATVRADVILGARIAEALGVKAFKAGSSEGTMVQYLFLVGFESDVKRAQALFESLLAQAKLAKAAWWKQYSKVEGEHMSANEKFLAKRQFIFGFADTVGLRLQREREEVVQEAGEQTALVLVKRTDAVDAWVKEHHAKIGNGRRIRSGVADGKWAGVAAGHKADISQAKVSKGSDKEVSA